MKSISNIVKNRIRKNIERDRNLERPIEAFSRVLWPFRESKLVFYVSLLAIIDFTSTFIALEISGSNHISEVGLLAKWALTTGGFPGLFVMDVICIGVLILLAVGVRHLYTRVGFSGLGRAAFVFLLIPYFISIWAVVVNNIIVVFLPV